MPPNTHARNNRLTIRRIMTLVAVAALNCACWTCLQRWESRRPVMYQQGEITRTIMLEAKGVVVDGGRTATEIRIEIPLATYTAQWTAWIEAWECVNGQISPLIRAKVSGDNGRFSLQPITVEVYGSPLDSPWLDRLLRVYRDKGWRFRVSRYGESEYLQRRQAWNETYKPFDYYYEKERKVLVMPAVR